MEFRLTLHDRKGTPLKMGDIVKISDGRRFTFFCEVKYLADEKSIAPFHTFSFSSVEKVDAPPPEATQSSETRYKIWYIGNQEEEDPLFFENYLMDWRQCEHLLSQKMYRIELIDEGKPTEK